MFMRKKRFCRQETGIGDWETFTIVSELSRLPSNKTRFLEDMHCLLT
jgi:hypothetical protein